MARIHIGKNGPAPCKAKSEATCTVDGMETDGSSEHYDSMQEAEKAYEEKLSQEYGLTGTQKKGAVFTDDDDDSENKETKRTLEDVEKDLEEFRQMRKEKANRSSNRIGGFGDYSPELDPDYQSDMRRRSALDRELHELKRQGLSR